MRLPFTHRDPCLHGGAIANTGSMQQFSILTDQAIHSYKNFIGISFTNAQVNDTYDVVCPTVQPMVNTGRNKNIIWDLLQSRRRKVTLVLIHCWLNLDMRT